VRFIPTIQSSPTTNPFAATVRADHLQSITHHAVMPDSLGLGPSRRRAGQGSLA
jgi:hypothetical protein